ncbi:MAG TPA: alpha/beta hydrolase [Acidobacteriaceae bacterium]|nr:alpha/beta hydrolase [Acidobacteriaceae bacterium]
MFTRISATLLILAIDFSAVMHTIGHARVAHAASEPTVRKITVEPGVQLEVLDWGGPANDPHARSLVFLSGLGDTAHVYDDFARRFTAKVHVYGITRRGFGASSKPDPGDANYSADRLGQDVIAVIDALHLDHPVLAGHSIAGEELSWIGSHDPQKVAGLIYLDADWGPGFYDKARGDAWLDMLAVRHRLEALRAGAVYDAAYHDSLMTAADQLSHDLHADAAFYAALAPVPAPPAPAPIPLAVLFGEDKFTGIHGPAMDIVACPHDLSPMFRGPLASDKAAQQALAAHDLEECTSQSAAFGQAMPWVPVVRIAHASHYIFQSNPEEVERAMNDFLAKTPTS